MWRSWQQLRGGGGGLARPRQQPWPAGACTRGRRACNSAPALICIRILTPPTMRQLLHHPWVAEEDERWRGLEVPQLELERMDDAPSLENWVQELVRRVLEAAGEHGRALGSTVVAWV